MFAFLIYGKVGRGRADVKTVSSRTIYEKAVEKLKRPNFENCK
jgi:Cdc6-like AAA superfamily ATPase